MNKIAAFILLITVLVHGNDTAAQHSMQKVRQYYATINKAELAIADDNYTEAGKKYEQAFKFKYPNGKDLYNAFVIAYRLKDTTRARSYLSWLSSKAYYFNVDSSDAFAVYLSQGLDSIRDAGKTEQLSQARRFYQSIWNADQKVRNEDPDNMRKMWEVDSVNAAAIKDYIGKNGFPSFDNFGFYTSMGNPFNPGVLWYILWHNRYEGCVLDDLAAQAVLNGDMPPEDWATVLSQRVGSGADPYHMLLDDSEYLEPEQVKAINKKRATIYLENLDDYKKKVKLAATIRAQISQNGGWYKFPVLNISNGMIVGYLLASQKYHPH